MLEYLGYDGWWYGDIDKARAVWTEMGLVAAAHGPPDLEAQAALLIARTYREQGLHTKAREGVAEALELAEKSGSRGQIARAKRQLGSWKSRDESVDDGVALLLQAITVLDELGDVEELASASESVADTLILVGRWIEAIPYYERALELLKGHVGYKPEVERRMATLYLTLGDVAKAETLAEDAVNVTAKDDWATVASTGSVLGTVRAAQGRLDEAEALMRQAAAIMADKGFDPMDEWLNLAEFLCRNGQVDEGRAWLAKVAQPHRPGIRARRPAVVLPERTDRGSTRRQLAAEAALGPSACLPAVNGHT